MTRPSFVLYPGFHRGIVCFDACYKSHFRVEEIKDFGACVHAPSEVDVQEFCRRGREEVFNSEKAFLCSRASDVRAPRGDTGPAREFWEGYGRLDGLRELGILTADLLPGWNLVGGGERLKGESLHWEQLLEPTKASVLWR